VHALWGAQSATHAEREEALRKCVQGWIQVLGPVTVNGFSGMLALAAADVFATFIALEVQGLLMRGSFEQPVTTSDLDTEWCERRILQRIHKLTIGARRKQVEPVTPAAFYAWLLGWQHMAPQTQLAGEEGVLNALAKLEGFEVPAVEWEKSILPARVANYDPRWLDSLCLSGAVGWGRVSPHPAFRAAGGAGPRRVIPANSAPITFYLRDSAAWLDLALRERGVEETKLAGAVSPAALRAWQLLRQRGACFDEDIQRLLNLNAEDSRQALWELAAAGLAAADGFDQLRSMIDPDRRAAIRSSYRKVRGAAGRWSLFGAEAPIPANALEKARYDDEAVESAARMLLARYGVVFRDVLTLESNIPRWGQLLRMLRRLEDRGEVRGGRFVSGFGGEQFALPEVLESLRAADISRTSFTVTIAGADPMNMIGVLVPGERVPAMPGKSFMHSTGEPGPQDAAALHIVHRRRVRSLMPPNPQRIPHLRERQASLF
jgi:ATP-dependent Lhr-like helicase